MNNAIKRASAFIIGALALVTFAACASNSNALEASLGKPKQMYFFDAILTMPTPIDVKKDSDNINCKLSSDPYVSFRISTELSGTDIMVDVIKDEINFGKEEDEILLTDAAKTGKVIANETIEVGGLPAYYYAYTYTDEFTDYFICVQNIDLVYNNEVYVINFFTSNVDSVEDAQNTFMNILKSVKFENGED